MRRRQVLGAGASIAAAGLAGCAPRADIVGGFYGIDDERGHMLRDRRSWPAPTVTHDTKVVIAGGGIAGLAATRALRLRGIDDYCVIDLEDNVGGNSRAGEVGGIRCPLGAHYLPVPGDDAHEVQDLLEELGLRARVAGRWMYDERHLCHTPQERLFINGQWQESLLPVDGVGADTLAQYRRLEEAIERVRKAGKWAIPVTRSSLDAQVRALDAVTFAAWLDANGFTDTHLRWYLDYCCRDDYGAGIATVSAWAGIHYFAARHGFRAPGSASRDADSAVLTWPEGNGWLAHQLSAPLGNRQQTSRIVTRIAAVKGGVEVDAYHPRKETMERWRAAHCIVALPLFIAARVVQDAPPALREAAAALRYSAWMVANVHIKEPLQDRGGAAPAWDNVFYGEAGDGAGLGYVDATHQSVVPVPRATVLTCYRAFGTTPEQRRALYEKPWSHWRDVALAGLQGAHPDVAAKATRVNITRYGHAMAVPLPGVRSNAALQALRQPQAGGRLLFAHADLSGYSIFEEAFTAGYSAGMSIRS